MLLISSELKELQLMLEITNVIAGKYHIKFGEEKSNVMKISRIYKLMVGDGIWAMGLNLSIKYSGNVFSNSGI